MPHDIFISHTKQDKLAADAACAILEKNGIRCWIATRDVPFGSNYAQELGRAIKGCRAMLIIFSGHTNLSRHVLSEITLAFNEDKTLLPLRIEEIKLTEDMDYFLRNSNWLDAFTPPLENHLQRVADNLLRMFPDRVQPQAPVTTASMAALAAAATLPPPATPPPVAPANLSAKEREIPAPSPLLPKPSSKSIGTRLGLVWRKLRRIGLRSSNPKGIRFGFGIIVLAFGLAFLGIIWFLAHRKG
jgi:hypothetical protein